MRMVGFDICCRRARVCSRVRRREWSRFIARACMRDARLRGLAYIDQFLPRGGADGGPVQDGHFFYGHYYAVQAMWQADGERWKRWYPAIRDLLVSRQQPDGSWADPVGSEYGTAMAAIILQMPDNSVPIFQR